MRLACLGEEWYFLMEEEQGSHEYSLKDYLLKRVLPMWKIAQSAGAVEYTDCTSAEGKNPH